MTPHSHDAAAEPIAHWRPAAVAISFAVLTVTALGQVAIFMMSGSVALLGDTCTTSPMP
ncbi:hypothetical protein [Nonomuraea cypriaca]|uniref:hypothetical protein n=1 Tax=Nonomuraea cypriaca TaxID=1187855 RepID=UPI001F3FBF6E|nr:hypothetical protein [Nonomuraea cypriaca]